MDAKLNHSDLSVLLAKETGITIAKAEQLTKAMFDLIIEGLQQDGVVKINGLGTFKLTDVASRSSVNVNTGEKFEIKGHKKLSFTPADTLKDDVNQPFAMFEPVEVDENYTEEDAAENEDFVTEENEVADAALMETEEVPVPEAAPEIVEEPKEEVKADVVEETVEPKEEKQQCSEPVMVHVPKKEKKPFAVPEKKKKSYKWLYVSLSVLIVAALAWVAVYSNFTVEKTTVVAVTETVKEQVKPVTETVTVEKVATDTVITEIEQNIESEKANDVALIEDAQEQEEYKFVITKELALLDLKDVTLADTVMYVADGTFAEHKVVANETLTRIALKYYGDKKLWPYIVKYNSLARPDNLRKGMRINIPKLKPIK